MKETHPTFQITLVNKASSTYSEKVVNAYCFAEAASQAYLYKNNRNQRADSGWWKIQSVVEVENEQNKNQSEVYGWSSEGEMT